MRRSLACGLLTLMLGCDAPKKLGIEGATCQASADCADDLQCIASTCVPPPLEPRAAAELKALEAELARLKQQEQLLARETQDLEQQKRLLDEHLRSLEAARPPPAPVAPPPAPVAPPPAVPPTLPPVKEAEQDLQDSLHIADIKAATAAPRDRALSVCKQFAGLGDKVKIKLTISGPTGTVSVASAADDAGKPQLGACCARELRAAKFPRTRNEQTGVMVSLSF